MQTYQDLNTFSNTSVQYGTWRDYTIQFGNSLGNYSATEYEDSLFPITQRANLEVFSDASADLLINLGFSNTVSLADVVYLGTNPNLEIFLSDSGNTANYVITGVRSIADYNEAFANVYVYTAIDSLVGFEITTELDDQRGNTLSYVGNISLVANPGFQSGNITFSEDIPANISGFALWDNVSSNTETYDVTFDTGAVSNGEIRYSGNTAASITVANITRADINTAFSANAFQYIPPADGTANTTITYTQIRRSDNRGWLGDVPVTWSGNSHEEYIAPITMCYSEDSLTDITGNRRYETAGAVLSTAQSRFGNASLYLDGTSQINQLPLGTIALSGPIGGPPARPNITIEGWIRRVQSPNQEIVLFDTVNVVTGWEMAMTATGNLIFRTQDFSTGVAVNKSITSAVTTANTWQHFAMVRSGNVMGLWLNGTSSGTIINDDFRESSTLRQLIVPVTATPAKLYLDEFRISYTARYTPGNNFTPPTSAFVVDSDTVMLFPFNGANGATQVTNSVRYEILDTRPDNIDPTITYNLSWKVANVNIGVIRYANIDTSELVLTNTKANLNAILATNAVQYVPSAGSTATNVITYRQIQNTSGQIQANVPMVMTSGLTHTEYIVPTAYSTVEDTILPMTGISITDLRPDRIDPSIQYQLTFASLDPANVKIRYNGVDQSSHTISNTKANLNAILGNNSLTPQLVPGSDWSGATLVTYSQLQVTDNILQANAVPITFDVSPGADYTLTTSYLIPVTANNTQRINYAVVDPDTNAVTYTVTVAQKNGPTGNIILNGVNQNANTITITNSRANVNAANISWLPNAGNLSPSDLNWSLSKTLANSAVVTIASNVVVDMDLVASNTILATRSYTTNNRTTIFSTSTPVIDTRISGTVTLTLTPNNGFIGLNDANASPVYQASSNVSSLNSGLGSIMFWPNRGQTSNATVRMQITQAGTTWVDTTIPLTAVSGNVPESLLGVTTFTGGTGTYVTDLRQRLYCRANILLVGGGATGSWGGGGGGAGGVLEASNQIISQTNLLYTVGSRGADTPIEHIEVIGGTTYRYGNGNPGGNTTIAGFLAAGGTGGQARWNNAGGNGGAVGAPQTFTGGTGNYTPPVEAGGGGAGAGSNGLGSGALPYAGGNAKQVTNIVNAWYAAGGGGDARNGNTIFTWTTWPFMTSPGYGRGGIGLLSTRSTNDVFRQRGTNGVIMLKFSQG